MIVIIKIQNRREVNDEWSLKIEVFIHTSKQTNLTPGWQNGMWRFQENARTGHVKKKALIG